MSEKLPDTLYVYRVYCGGVILRLLSEHHTAKELWKVILDARKLNDSGVWFWCPPVGMDYAQLCVDANAVTSIQDHEGPVLQPNLREQRQRQVQKSITTNSVTLGKVALKHSVAGNKKVE